MLTLTQWLTQLEIVINSMYIYIHIYMRKSTIISTVCNIFSHIWHRPIGYYVLLLHCTTLSVAPSAQRERPRQSPQKSASMPPSEKWEAWPEPGCTVAMHVCSHYKDAWLVRTISVRFHMCPVNPQSNWLNLMFHQEAIGVYSSR